MVLIAGATGYLGRHLCQEFQAQGWRVRALVRQAGRLTDLDPPPDEEFLAQATSPQTLAGAFEGLDAVVSSLGITRQKDGLSYWDVDFQANLNLLTAARAAGVARFAYVSVFDADHLGELEIVKAKEAFVRELVASGLDFTIIRPNGFFSDMAELLAMAEKGRVWLFGDGRFQGNPIHGADLARAIRLAVEEGRPYLDIGGPEVLTQRQMARAAFAALGKDPKISLAPMWLRDLMLFLIRRLTPKRVSGPLEFFLTVMARDMIAPVYGTRTLAGHFRSLAESKHKGVNP